VVARAIDLKTNYVLEFSFFNLKVVPSQPAQELVDTRAPPLHPNEVAFSKRLYTSHGDNCCLLLELSGVLPISSGRTFSNRTKECGSFIKQNKDPTKTLTSFLSFMRMSPEGILARAIKRRFAAVVPLPSAKTLPLVACSQIEMRRNYDSFLKRGGLSASSCPKTYHLNAFAQSKCAGTTERGAGLVIGGNTGSDCVGFARFISGDPSLSLTRWQSELHKLTRHRFPRPKCPGSGAGLGVDEYPLLSPKGIEKRTRLICVEPLPQNFNYLNATSHLGSWPELEMVHAAVANFIPEKGTFDFPSQAVFGLETAHIRLSQETTSTSSNSVPVRATTVDELVANEMGGTDPYLLVVDTEGYDGLVLQGANRTLASGRVKYLEFEFHNIPPWRNMDLRVTIESLDATGYTCYWAQPRLVRITRCWDWWKFGDWHDWSNVVCAQRDDPCWSAALSSVASPTAAQ